MVQYHFIAGLPRSGSSLLAAILRQNPAFHASFMSPVGGIFSVMQQAMSPAAETAPLISNLQRERLLRGLFEQYYADQPAVIYDTNRQWPAKLSALTKLFPHCRILCCVRELPWIMDSIERLLQRNPWQLSGLAAYDPGSTVFSRAQRLMRSDGLIGYALDALREGYYGEHGSRMLMIEYDGLARDPREVLGGIYEWLGLPYYAGHDFARIEPLPGAAEFDAAHGTPGLHDVRPRAEWIERRSILPPELWAWFPPPFWRPNAT